MSDERVEITFTPTRQDYALATRWITREAMGSLYWPYLIAVVSVAVTAAFGFILLFDVAMSTADPVRADQALAGALLFIGILYVGLILKFVARRFVMRRTYIENGFFLAPRTMIFSKDGISNNSAQQQMHISWKNILGIFENKHFIFIKLEPAFTLFIPKRIATSPDELTRLKEFAEKMRAESISLP